MAALAVYSVSGSGPLFMSATAKIGTAAPSGATRAWAPAALACMGIVFGDIGTSPLYALSVAAKAASPDGQLSPQAVLGVVSLIFWSLIIVISIKYAILIMRADNHGEGGILALLALISPRRAKQSRRRAIMVVIGLVGATLLYGDGTIGRAGDRGHCDRLPGGHLRGLFLDAASHSARLPAAHEHRPHSRSRNRPNLYPVRQLDARCGHARRRHRLRLLGRAGRRLWHSRFVTDGYHDADGDVRRFALEAQSHPRLRGKRQSAGPGPALFRLDLDENLRRGLVPTTHRFGHCIPYAHVAQGRGDDGRHSSGSS